MTVRVGFLGGLGEIGRNCAVIEVEGKLALIDCGLMFPEAEMLGVDLVLPDFSWVLDRADDVECVVLTHGHEDHVGALAYFLRELNVPVYGTEMAVAFARSRVEELGVEPDLRALETNVWVEHGPFTFTLVRVTHSTPQAAGIVFDTPQGLIVHSGDFKLDSTPVDGEPTDLQTFAGFGRQGVRLLLSDSTNAEVGGTVPSERTVGPHLAALTSEAEGRVIIACFASHVHRVQQAIDAVTAAGRKFVFLGRSMVRNSAVARELGLLSYDDADVLEMDELMKLDDSKTAVICTGSQGEPFAALSLMAGGQHRHVKLDDNDTVIISATPIPGNESKVSRVINNLVRRGVTVHHGRNATVHVSGHAAQEELKTFLNVIKPQSFIPVHGEYRHLVAHAKLAGIMGVPDIHVLEDGDVIVLDDDGTRAERAVLPAGYVYLDGSGIGDLDGALRDRKHLADEGVVIVTLGVDLQSGDIIFGPDVDSHGLTDEPDEVHKLVTERVIDGIKSLDLPLDHDTVRAKVRSMAGRAVKAHLSRRPVVFPVIIEV